jgi:RNA polymerase sigma-70 factor (ECF subfamily)
MRGFYLWRCNQRQGGHRTVSIVGDEEHARLMGRYCDGDPAAFHRLYALLAPKILAYLVGLISDRALAEDLLQATFLKIHQSRASYVRDANPVPWFYTIAHRTCLDELRKRKRAPVKLTSDGELPREPSADLTGRAEENQAPDEEAAGARISLADLDGLPQNQREALVLTKVHGHSVSQAAMIAGTTPGAIKLRAHRAYVTLRQRMAGRTGEASRRAK